jgi:hypothetical protein
MPNLPTDSYTPSLIGDDYVFVTDDGRVYSVTFTEQPFFTDKQFELADRTYELFLTLEKAPPAYSKDPQIGATMSAIIRDFIRHDPLRIVFFTCDTADGRHYARFKRFNEWFMENNDGYHMRFEDTIAYPAIHKMFLISVIIRNDHPGRLAVLSAFMTVNNQIRSQK